MHVHVFVFLYRSLTFETIYMCFLKVFYTNEEYNAV